MGKRERHEPGTFCWVDLVTTDVGGAKSFYGELFGWTYEDMPAGENSTYSMMSLDGDVVCGIFEMDGEEMNSLNITRHWQSYVSVDDAEAVTERAKEIGGEVIEEPFDVMGAGRSAVITDPTGATFPLWQPEGHIGSARVNDVGCFCLNQLNSQDPEKASDFYKALFDWEIFPVSEDPPYRSINNRGSLNGGMMQVPESTPSHWLVYFTSDDLEASQKQIENLGGTVMIPPVEVPPEGRILIASDPQGATFALFEGEVDD